MTEIETSIQGGVLTLTLNAPARANAWNDEMRAQLTGEILAAKVSNAIEAIVITGSGDRAFCAGQDVNPSRLSAGGTAGRWSNSYQRLYAAIREFDRPIVAAVNGAAVGSGFHLALMADVRIAHPGVLLGQNEIRSGGSSMMGMHLLYDLLGRLRTAEIMLRGQLLTAAEAKELGLLTELVEASEVRSRAHVVALKLAALPKEAFALAKARLRELSEPAFRRAFDAVETVSTPYTSLDFAKLKGPAVDERAPASDTDRGAHG